VTRCSTAGAGPRRGYVPADDVLPPVLPLAAALRYTAALRAVRSAQQAVDNVLGMAGLTPRAAARCGELDPGERKRAAVAAELLSRPDQLFLDGPTSGLDPAQAAEVLSLLRRLADSGITVLLTTSSPLDVARCDKVAVLAAGGHLAFFGTPDAARGYFGADSLEEIYERLAGVGDPAAAWSRRFFPTSAGFSPLPATATVPGPASLVPDSAGPHSAGRVTVLPDPAGHGNDGRALGLALPAHNGQAVPDSAGVRAGLIRAVRQLPILIRRNIDLVRRSALAGVLLVAAPAAVLLAFALLIGAGAFDAVRASLAWTVFGGFCIGLAYGLPQVCGELGGLRAERFCGLSATGWVLAKLVVLLPALAAADAVALVVPAGLGRLPYGYGPAYLTLLLSSAVALALALLLSATALLPPTALLPSTALARDRPLPVTATWLPALLLAFAVLTLLDRPDWPDWLALGLLAVVLGAGVTVLIARRVPAVAGGRPATRF
jgi:ABC transport system ATP-binding/permease protein